MNGYLNNLKKIEFVVTYACTGRCKHCSEGDHVSCGKSIDPRIAADAVRKVAAEYELDTVMAFGGEPLLFPDTVCAIMSAAKEAGVARRQVITNGYFTRDTKIMGALARRLAECGVNDLLLSVDAFHQQTIPVEVVMQFARELNSCGVPVRLSPAWLVSPSHDNPYNKKTRELLALFEDMDIVVGEGNIVFPEGNALKYLSEYFEGSVPENPYVEDPLDVRCLSFSPDGGVLGGNVYRQDIMDIIRDYAPQEGII